MFSKQDLEGDPVSLTPTEQSEWNHVVQQIKLGKYDGCLQDVLEAIQFRAAGGATSFRWRLTWEDLEVTEDNVTLGELVDIEKALDVSWVAINPAKSAQQCVAILEAALKHRSELSEAEVAEKVSELTAGEALECLDQYEVVRPPLEQSTPATT